MYLPPEIIQRILMYIPFPFAVKLCLVAPAVYRKNLQKMIAQCHITASDALEHNRIDLYKITGTIQNVDDVLLYALLKKCTFDVIRYIINVNNIGYITNVHLLHSMYDMRIFKYINAFITHHTYYYIDIIQECAAKHRNGLEICKYLHSTSNFDFAYCMQYAAGRKNGLDNCKFLYSIDVSITHKSLIAAAKHKNRIQICTWLIDNGRMTSFAYADIIQSVKRGCLRICELLSAAGIKIYMDAMGHAITTGNIYMCRWLSTRVDTIPMFAFAYHMRVDMQKWVIHHMLNNPNYTNSDIVNIVLNSYCDLYKHLPINIFKYSKKFTVLPGFCNPTHIRAMLIKYLDVQIDDMNWCSATRRLTNRKCFHCN